MPAPRRREARARNLARPRTRGGREWRLLFCRDWRYTATIACTRIGDNFFPPMPEQIKARTEENTDGCSAHERDAKEVEKDADPEPQFRTPAGRRRGWWRCSEHRSVGPGIGECVRLPTKRTRRIGGTPHAARCR